MERGAGRRSGRRRTEKRQNTRRHGGVSGGKRFEVRTDLALESRENVRGAGRFPDGVVFREWKDGGISHTEVQVENDRGAKALGKPVGIYLTLEAGKLGEKDEGYHEDVAEELAAQLKRLACKALKRKREQGFPGIHVLAVGLGNPYVTPDSLGPRVLGNVRVTRKVADDGDLPVLSGIVPGVMAQTGMETAEILRGIIRETRPDLVIAIDALAARSIRRLGTTIQLTNTGIHPGSGVGNHRHGLTEESLGIPVLAIGVPTVVGAPAIAQDTVAAVAAALEKGSRTKGVGNWLEQMGAEEQYQLIREVLDPELGQLYVTPPDIDETVKQLSFTISEGIHRAFYGI